MIFLQLFSILLLTFHIFPSLENIINYEVVRCISSLWTCPRPQLPILLIICITKSIKLHRWISSRKIVIRGNGRVSSKKPITSSFRFFISKGKQCNIRKQIHQYPEYAAFTMLALWGPLCDKIFLYLGNRVFRSLECLLLDMSDEYLISDEFAENSILQKMCLCRIGELEEQCPFLLLQPQFIEEISFPRRVYLNSSYNKLIEGRLLSHDTYRVSPRVGSL